MMLDLPLLLKKYSLKPKGVLHIGSSYGQESSTYHELGIDKMIFVEALPEVFEILKTKVIQYDAECINACVTDKDGEEITFNVANNEGQSSSIYGFGNHTIIHPEVKFTRSLVLKSARMDTLLQDREFTGWFLNIDLQGAELLALKSLGNYLNQFSCALLEINKREVYKGCALVEEIDEYLSEFKRVETGKWVGDSWTDGFYLKKSLC